MYMQSWILDSTLWIPDLKEIKARVLFQFPVKS